METQSGMLYFSLLTSIWIIWTSRQVVLAKVISYNFMNKMTIDFQ